MVRSTSVRVVGALATLVAGLALAGCSVESTESNQIGRAERVDSIESAQSTAAVAAALAVGDLAPDFLLPGSDGRDHALADMRGTTVVLAFFPKAFTGG